MWKVITMLVKPLLAKYNVLEIRYNTLIKELSNKNVVH